MPLSTVTGVEAVLSPATKDAAPVLPDEINGVWSVAVTVMARVRTLLNCGPALTEKLIVRVAVLGETRVSA